MLKKRKEENGGEDTRRIQTCLNVLEFAPREGGLHRNQKGQASSGQLTGAIYLHDFGHRSRENRTQPTPPPQSSLFVESTAPRGLLQ